MSKRERYIGIGVGAALLLLAVDRFAITPYDQRSKDLNTAETDIMVKEKAATFILDARRSMDRPWKQLRSGMKGEVAEADTLVRDAMRDCGDASGILLGDIDMTKNNAAADGFRELNFRVRFSGRTATVSRMLWHVETLPIPLKILSIEISSQPNNSDELRAEMTIATLVAPNDTARANPIASAGGGR